MAKYGTPPPLFSPKFFFTKMTQNGLKWILNATLKNVTFFWQGPPSDCNICYIFFIFFEVGDGQELVTFFQQQFCFSGQETVAIMGAHTFGRLHIHTSLFRYVWTSRGTKFFNNDYYKMITDETRWFFDDDGPWIGFLSLLGVIHECKWLFMAIKSKSDVHFSTVYLYLQKYIFSYLF